jgi:ABC-type siderophore export system fused ATPase/permease subunit
MNNGCVLYFCSILYYAYLGVTYILSIIIAFFVTILPIEIVLHFFTIDDMTTTDAMTTTDDMTTLVSNSTNNTGSSQGNYDY